MSYTHFNDENYPEYVVIEESSNDVSLFLIDDSAVNLVHHIHKEECCEYHSVYDHFISRAIVFSQRSSYYVVRLIKENQSTQILETKYHDNLVNYLNNHVSPHRWCHYFVSTTNSFLFCLNR